MKEVWWVHTNSLLSYTLVIIWHLLFGIPKKEQIPGRLEHRALLSPQNLSFSIWETLLPAVWCRCLFKYIFRVKLDILLSGLIYNCCCCYLGDCYIFCSLSTQFHNGTITHYYEVGGTFCFNFSKVLPDNMFKTMSTGSKQCLRFLQKAFIIHSAQ